MRDGGRDAVCMDRKKERIGSGSGSVDSNAPSIE
jgi:hypothetical protein